MSTEGDISSSSWTEQSSDARSYSNTNSPAEQKQMSGTLSTSNKRKKILLFTVIAVLVLIIIAMMAVMIALLKSQYTTNETSDSSSNYQDRTIPSSAAATTVTIYDVGAGGTSGDPPCSSHTVVNDPSRNVGTSGIGSTCDNGPLFNTSIGGRWIRFVGNGGTMLPSYSPGIQHRGGYSVAWSNMTLPSTAGTSINGTGCIETLPFPCVYRIHLSVVNCGTFYVYFLAPLLLCNARYCTV